MKTIQRLDVLNFFLIIVSLILAYFLPFKTFLYGYVILGPLHYLTEINWLDEKKYYLKEEHGFKWWAIGLTLVFILPYLLQLPFLSGMEHVAKEYQPWINGVTIGALGLAIGFVLTGKRNVGIIMLVVFALTVVFLRDNAFYNQWVGVFLPTIIHVYLFTLLFMLYGTMKVKSKVGYLNVALMILVPFILQMIPLDSSQYEFQDSIKSVFIENKFHVLNANLAGLVGSSDGTGFFFYEVGDLKIQMFVAFAYIYHYLNWFTKTSVIGWHKQLNWKKISVIAAFWAASVFFYWYDFKTGFILVLFLSVLHVFVEFPLNVVSIKGIFSEMSGQKNNLSDS